VWIWLVGCQALVLDVPVPNAVVVYNLGESDIPTPNDVVRDAEQALLALPISEDQSEAERAFRTGLNRQDGWSSTSAPAFRTSHPISPESVGSPESVSAETVQVWQWGDLPVRVEDVEILLSEDGLEVEVVAPETGWERGGTYFVVVSGLQTEDGVPIGPDASFAYLRSPESLLEHDKAVPGATREERAATLARLEGIRSALVPFFQHAEGQGLAREQISALWSFTVTARPELALDSASGRVPVPIDLLRDPETGLVSLPADPEDDDLVSEAKLVLNQYDGFSLSGSMTFESTAPLAPATVSPATVELWLLGPESVQVAAQVSAWNEDGPCVGAETDCDHVVITPEVVPLAPASSYALVVREGITDLDGLPLLAMAPGQLLTLGHPLLADGQSTVSSVETGDAARLEPVRATVSGLLDRLGGEGREGIAAAWPFRTMDAEPALLEAAAYAETLSVDPNPTITDRLEPASLLGDDGLGLLFPPPLNPAWVAYEYRLDGVAEVITGTIPSPQFLHPATRHWTEPAVVDVLHFVATIPAGIPENEPVPVVIFGHALVTDRRWTMTIAGELAQKGFATISIDFPYHGERTHCVDASLMAIPNFLPESLHGVAELLGVNVEDDLIRLYPCVSGEDATCSPTGECLDEDGNPEPFAAMPIIDVLPAAGSAMLDVHDLPHVPDHIRQGVVDLGALRRSLQMGDWETALGRELYTDEFLYAGQSLGGIMGALYVPLDPTIKRAVLNVPGANLVGLFQESIYFSPQLEDYLESREVAPGSYDEFFLLNTAHWLVDAVDPHAVAHVWARDEREGLIQIDRVDANSGDIVIPNSSTDVLQQASGLPMLEYPSILHGDLVIPLLGDGMLEDLADFLAEGQ
jgi:hypothetical protein